MDVIREVLDTTRDFEAPTRFYYWSILASVSAVMKDRVWFNMGGNYTLYPNIYVLLFGPSGIRKGPPISLAEDLVTIVDNTRVIDGRSSIEAVIKELGTFQTREGKQPIKDSCGFMVSSEMSSSIIESRHAMDILTNLYDRQYNNKPWKYRLKVGESSQLENPTITWFTGTNEALFKDFMPEKNLHGGLIGRMFVISENKKNKTNSLMFKTVSPDKQKIAGRLIELTKLKGEFTMSDEVRMAVHEWYEKWDNETAPNHNDDTGFVSRVEDFVIKIAMLTAIARRGELELTIEDILEGTNAVLPLIKPTQAVVNKTKKDDPTIVKKRSLVLLYLINRADFREERGRLLRNLSPQLDHEDLDRIVSYMIQMNTLTLENQGGKVILKLRVDRPEVANWIKNYKN